MERNRKCAQDQQAKEVAKHFQIAAGDLPKTVKAAYYDMPIEGLAESVNGRQVGIGDCQGARPTMEDAEIACSPSFQVQNTNHTFDVFGVFDGHGEPQLQNF